MTVASVLDIPELPLSGIPLLTVIIPTTAQTSRKAYLLRALGSTQQQTGCQVRIVVVVNGESFDSELLAQMASVPNVVVEQISTPSLPGALAHGRSCVDTKYFCFLDDDDELLPNTLGMRIDVMEHDANLDVLVTNGFNIIDGVEMHRLPPALPQGTGLLHSLIRQNWLASCGGIYRSDRIPVQYFANLIPCYEWTTVALRLALERNICFLDVMSYRVHDTPGSLSKSDEFIVGSVRIVKEMLGMPLPSDVHDAVRRQLAPAMHSVSDHFRRRRVWREAWRYHLNSLLHRGGLRYLTYTRHLIWRGSQPGVSGNGAAARRQSDDSGPSRHP